MLIISDDWTQKITNYDFVSLKFNEKSAVNNILQDKIRIKEVCAICEDESGLASMLNVLSSIIMDELMIVGWFWPESLKDVQVKKLEFTGKKHCTRNLPVLPTTIEILVVGSLNDIFPAFHKEIYEHCKFLEEYIGPNPHHYLEHDIEFDDLCVDFIQFVVNDK